MRVTASAFTQGATAVDIVHQLARAAGDPATHYGASTRGFLRQALKQLGDRIPPRELDVSDRVGDETLARRATCFCASDYGIGEMHDDSRGP